MSETLSHPVCGWAGPSSVSQGRWACWTTSQPGCSPLTRCQWTWSSPETQTHKHVTHTVSKTKKPSSPTQNPHQRLTRLPLSWAWFLEPCTNAWPRTRSRSLCGRARGRLSAPGQSHRSEEDAKGWEVRSISPPADIYRSNPPTHGLWIENRGCQCFKLFLKLEEPLQMDPQLYQLPRSCSPKTLFLLLYLLILRL